MSSLHMMEDYNQINDINPFQPGEAPILPGLSNADVNYAAPERTEETPAQWEQQKQHPCVDGEVRLGCHVRGGPKHCQVKHRSSLPAYDIEQGRWSLSKADCSGKRLVGGGSLMDSLLIFVLLIVVIFYLNRE
jgi:hypothetical protein